MSTSAKQRRTAGDWSLQKELGALQKMKTQSNQRQSDYRKYSESMRKEVRSTGKGLLLKLLMLPLAMMVIGTFYMAMHIHLDPSKDVAQNHINEQLLSFVSGKATSQQPKEEESLPQWITDYIKWHQEVRAKFPGDELFTNKDAPKLLVRTCLGICGGLHDRLGQLPWDIYLAMRLNRVLLMAWQRPKELEHFLLPPIVEDEDTLAIDWRIPESQKFGFDHIKRVRSEVTELFGDGAESHPDEGFWKIDFEKAMVRAGAPSSPGVTESYDPDAKFLDTRLLRHRLLGHLDEIVLEERLEREGYYKDESYWKASDLHKAPTFGRIWKLFFRPSPAVRGEIVDAMEKMDLLLHEKEDTGSPNDLPPTVPYKAVHCRVRHPKAHPPGKVMKGKNEKYPADKTGLPWIVGEPQRAFAIETANKALICAKEIPGIDKTAPVYFLSDSNDLVNHVALELADSTYLKEHGSNASWVDPSLLETIQSQKVVARNTTLENAHIDRQKGRPPPAYYATFVDLYLAMKANCVVYGIGYYAAFAAKISGTDCAYLYAKESWGTQVEKSAKICPNTD